MRHILNKNYRIYTFVKVAIAFVFLLSGVIRILKPQGMINMLNAIDLLHPVVNFVTVYLISIIEILISISLFTGWKARTGVVACVAFSSIFLITAIWEATGRDDIATCGCFGTFSSGASYMQALIRSSIIFFMSLTVLFFTKTIQITKNKNTGETNEEQT